MHYHASDRTCYKSAWGPKLMAVLFYLLGLAVLPCALCSIGTESHRRVDTTQEGVPIAVGFDFGQAYSTSVAHFPNGTISSLAKVPGDEEYTALMQRLVREPTPQDQPGHLQVLWRYLMRALRVPPSRDATILVRMAAALKAESEAALGGRAIGMVAVTAPWIAAWDGQIPPDSIINDVLVLVGIEPVSWEARHPPYLGETNSLLAASGRGLCPDRWCGCESDRRGQGADVFLISFTNRSLHTSLQLAQCFSFNSWDNHLSAIDPKYGLDKIEESDSPEDFWVSLRGHLLDQVVKHTLSHPENFDLPFLVLVYGEAATGPGFTKVLQEVVTLIPYVRVFGCREQADNSRPQECTEQQQEMALIIPDDPTFAAARGAAFWMSMRLDGSYCNEWYAANSGECMSQYDMHDEL